MQLAFRAPAGAQRRVRIEANERLIALLAPRGLLVFRGDIYRALPDEERADGGRPGHLRQGREPDPGRLREAGRALRVPRDEGPDLEDRQVLRDARRAGGEPKNAELLRTVDALVGRPAPREHRARARGRGAGASRSPTRGGSTPSRRGCTAFSSSTSASPTPTTSPCSRSSAPRWRSRSSSA